MRLRDASNPERREVAMAWNAARKGPAAPGLRGTAIPWLCGWGAVAVVWASVLSCGVARGMVRASRARLHGIGAHRLRSLGTPLVARAAPVHETALFQGAPRARVDEDDLKIVRSLFFRPYDPLDGRRKVSGPWDIA